MPKLGFEMDGTFYDMPMVGSFDLDEDRIFFRATGLHAEDVWLGLQDDGEMTFRDLMRKEGFLTALAHIAYRRENPALSDDAIAEILGNVNRMELFTSLIASSVVDDEEDEDPLATSSTTERDESASNSKPAKQRSKSSKGKHSGKHGAKSSGRPDTTPEDIGTTASDSLSTSGHLRRVG